MTDEHNPRYAGCYGHATVQTPAIDRLAQLAALLEEDPDELRNGVAEPEHQSLVRALEARLLSTWDLAPIRAELDAVLARQLAVDGRFSYSGPNRTTR